MYSVPSSLKEVRMSPLLSFIPLLTFVVILIVLGSIIGTIAKRKHRNPWLWRVTEALGFPVALIAVLFFKDLNSLSAEDQERSRLREKIICGAVIAIWVVSLLMRFRAI